MTEWKPEESAPKDGTVVLLWARLGSYPPESDNYFRIVGFWHRSIGKWKVAPEHLNPQEELHATHWAPIPKPPEAN
jgi:hypothetical protein